MRRMGLLLLAGSMLVSMTMVAFAGSTRDLRSLTQELDDELSRAPVDDDTAAEIRGHLLASLRLARGAGVDGRCVALAQASYDKVFQPTTSLEKSAALCRQQTDSALMQFAFEIHAKTVQESTAVERAAKLAQRADLIGKADLVEYAYAKFAVVKQPSSALEAATDLVSRVNRGQLGCVKRADETYAKQFQPTESLRRAVELCAK